MSFLPRLLRPSLFPSAHAGPSRIPSLSPSNPLRVPRIPFNSTGLSPFSTSSPSLVKQKLKSHSGCKKRFFANANGLFKRAQTGKAHLNTAFSTARINRLAKQVYVTKTQGRKLKKMLPYA
ncbi:mitochondrial 54S ribosomal protein bL35m [Kwoniella dejecticola CBS 10117]|uniref:50S ribosomal protein L35 n=1 Tax=Kwoniella dejecticola CBS 10117 TaxID=1296121 RepID=A0A1A6AE14_9TREE|nr:ribosomal protein L35 [Kwoniella dejecticola CBS 10117]OBR88312.1 ribosomal protein L35 [Kwoniella dejecticola CBS 10117]